MNDSAVGFRAFCRPSRLSSSIQLRGDKEKSEEWRLAHEARILELTIRVQAELGRRAGKYQREADCA